MYYAAHSVYKWENVSFPAFVFFLMNSLYVVSQLSQFSLACKCKGKIKYAKLKLKYQDILHWFTGE